MDQPHYLIVEQQQKPADSLPDLLKQLAAGHNLDIYQCRQRLIGQGRALLTKGSQETLKKISPRLLQAGFRHWLFAPSKPQFVPHRLRGVQIDNDKIVFSCQKKTITFPKGSTILAVFAEMSGALAAKSVTQLLASNAYRGKDNIRHLNEDKIHKTILHGEPLLDLYLLDDKNQITDAVRIFPGKFDPQGLGERATISSKQNLLKIIELAKEYADKFSLHTDFGLVNLPGCTLLREAADDLDATQKNQISLARYGWLLADLERVGPVGQTATTDNESLTGAVTAAMLTQNPALAATGELDEVLPVAKEIAAEVNAAEESDTVKKPPETADLGLPAPPPITRSSKWKTSKFLFGGAGAIGVAVFMAIADNMDNRVIRTVVENGFASGAIFFSIAAAMFWGGFYYLRLKRQIENTPTSRIRSIAMGMVEVKGQAIRQYALISPMSHTPCVYYRLKKYRREKENQWRVTSVTGSDNVPFLLEDDTGRVEIDPAGCRISAGTKQEGTPGQIGLSHFSSDSDEKWCEEIIVEGTLLYILGFAAVKRQSGPSLTERKIEALRELKRNPQNLRQFDTDGDGNISEVEWDAAREAVTEKVLHESLQEQRERKKQEEHVVIGKKTGRPLVITETHSEDHLTRRLTQYMIPLFIGAAVATSSGIYLLITYLR